MTVAEDSYNYVTIWQWPQSK